METTRNSARVTDQRGSYAFSCSPCSIHSMSVIFCLLPTSGVDRNFFPGGGSKWKRSFFSPPLPFPSFFSPFPSFPFHSHSPPPFPALPFLRSRTPKIQVRCLGGRCELFQRGLGAEPQPKSNVVRYSFKYEISQICI